MSLKILSKEKLLFAFLIILLLLNINLKYYNIKIKKFNYYNEKDNKSVFEKIELANSLLKIFAELYDYSRGGYKKPRFSRVNKNYSITKKKLNICICAIGKDENLYAKEFVDYYIKLGVDKIFIYDNNDIEGENFDIILDYYIKHKKVEIIDIRGLSSIQMPIYNYCYRKNKGFYDWIGFLDFDEFLFIKSKESIKNYFYHERFNKCQTIFFNWIMYNDNNLIKYDNRSLIERFKKPTLKFYQGKSFVRGKIDDLFIPTTHLVGINIKQFCNSNGEFIYPNDFYGHKFEKKPKAYIKHYYTKTVEEFCDKVNKGNSHFHKNHTKYNIFTIGRIKLFFKLNKPTKQKMNIIEKCTGIKIKKNFLKHK